MVGSDNPRSAGSGTRPARTRALLPVEAKRRATSRLSFCARPNRLSSGSETACFCLAVIERRFLGGGVASAAVSAIGVAAATGRHEDERRAAGFVGAEVPSILSTSFNALISACRRSIAGAPKAGYFAAFFLRAAQ